MAEYVYGEREKRTGISRLRSLAGMSFTEKLSVREVRLQTGKSEISFVRNRLFPAEGVAFAGRESTGCVRNLRFMDLSSMPPAGLQNT